MTSPQVRARVELYAWVAIYGGMFAVILGVVIGSVHLPTGWSVGVLGGLGIAAGVALIIIRSRMAETPAPGAQSDSAGRMP
jgi:hypothetical protein